MTALAALIVSPLTWMIFGGAAQLSLVSWVRSRRTYMWAASPLVMIICLVAAVPTSRSGSPYAFQIAMGFGLLFTAIMIASAVPAAMNGGILLAITTSFWVSFLIAEPAAWWRGLALLPAGLVAAVPTVVLLGIAVTGHRPARWMRFLLYLWALFALVVVGVMRFPASDFTSLESAGRGWIVILAASYLGAHVAMLVHNVLALLLLIPVAREEETFGQRWREVERYAGRLIACYSPEPVGLGRAALIVAGQGGFVWLLSRWRPEGVGLAVHASLSLCLVASTFFAVPAKLDGLDPLPTGGDIKRAKRRKRA